MYIQPDSRIVLLTDVPLNPKQTDTYYFETRSEQFNTFYSKKLIEFPKQTYQRVERGRIRLDVNAEKVYSANYLMFQNTAYGTKWFYAFITAVEYINDNTTEFVFEIDDIQTWYFEYDTPPCFVERMHSSTDAIGDNIEPEPVDAGELVPNDYYELHHDYHYPSWNSKMIVVSWIDPDVEVGENRGNFIEGTFTSGKLKIYNGSDYTSVQNCMDFIKVQMAQHPDSIITIYMTPRMAINFLNESDNWFEIGIPNTSEGAKYYYTLTPVQPDDTLNGYVPKNKKMFTYPYNCLKVTTVTGKSMALRYEFFDNRIPKFEECWNILYPVSSSLRPTNYRTVTQSSKDLALSLEGFPMCMWSGDAYKAWEVQSAGSNIGTFVTDILMLIGGLALAPVSGGASLVGVGLKIANDTANKLNEAYKASIAADVAGGGVTGNNAWANDMLDYYVSRVSCTKDIAQSIDQYFTSFGYAQRKIMKPLRQTRLRWTYVQTVGCVVTGKLPADSKVNIANIYDTGIRFWAEKEHFGNLTLENTPLFYEEDYVRVHGGAGMSFGNIHGGAGVSFDNVHGGGGVSIDDNQFDNTGSSVHTGESGNVHGGGGREF